MKKTSMALLGGAILLAATPAIAATVIAGPFKNHGDCNNSLAWTAYDARKGINNAWLNQGTNLSCQLISGQWYVVLN